ncbi:N4-like RNA polymerase [Vibrio phage D505]
MDKFLLEQQRALELKTANYHADLYFEEEREDLIDKPMDYLFNYMADCEDKDYSYSTQGSNILKYRDDLIEIDTWLQESDPKELENILFKMMSSILTVKGGMTAQALAGMVFNRVDFEEPQRRLKLASIFMDAVVCSPNVTIRNTFDKIFFEPIVPVSANKRKDLELLGHPLPMLYPPKVKSNKSVGFNSFQTSMIAGGSLKYHDKDICLDHFNRLNAMEFTCELRLGMIVEPQFKNEAKCKDNGEWETPEEVIKRFEQFKRDKEELPVKIREMVKHGNRFYIPHYGDTRIRTYAKQHHFNYLGSKFAKGLVQFKEKELISGDW